jgi:DNA mismatch endonuclease, patch repair protein
MESPKLRRRTMQAVKSKDTGPEMTVRRLLHARGFRYRLHRKDLPGCPDLVFPSRRKVIFVHGCFWHGHDCARGARVPKTNVEYWTAKIGRNRSRDATAVKQLRRDGWGVLVLWECKLNQRDLLKRVESFLRNDSPPMGNAR